MFDMLDFIPEDYLPFLIPTAATIAVLFIVVIFTVIFKLRLKSKVKKEAKIKKSVENFVKYSTELDVDVFLENRSSMQKIKGIYILHNEKNDKYYVGQSRNDVIKGRLYDHLCGSGSPGVYEDYKKKHPFTVKVLPFFDNLDDMESFYIKQMRAITDTIKQRVTTAKWRQKTMNKYTKKAFF